MKNKQEKKSLKDILNSYWNENKNKAEGKISISQVKKKMKKASLSYKSFIEMHNLLKKTYKTLINKKK
ncbi:MAG: hypothetical protein AMS24_05020 [Chlamydiae bacterium SM23_39]|nr:MAG: hypothetical protein AMS24_05020 [Chlamydiae bacterium SM23_39]